MSKFKSPRDALKYHVTGAIERGEAKAIEAVVKLTCSMTAGCQTAVSYIDDKGFVYCSCHGKQRQSYTKCRKLKPVELKTLQSGAPLARY